MRVRPARRDELSRVFELTYDLAGPVSRTRHIVECKRNPKLRSGTHYVLEDADGQFLATMTAYRFAYPFVGTTIGLANFFVAPAHRRRGLGRQLLSGTLADLEAGGQRVFYLLSEIGAEYYEPFGFRELPISYELAPQCVPMLRCPESDWPRLSQNRPYLLGLMAFVD